ncbi:MAG: dolichyl-phosphate beta-glucosyltransferase [Patescibacteria group bacterium]
MNPKLSVIIPCYNEEKRIKKTLEAVSAYLQKQHFTWEVLLVSDGSKDGTSNVVNEWLKGKTGFYFIDRKENRGKGYTVREGMLKATGDIRLFTDADNSTDISHYDKMSVLFDAGYDVVICSRDEKDAKGAKQAIPQVWHKRFLGNMGNLFIQIVAVRGIWDTQCGFKACTAAVAQRIFKVSRINRWGFDIEMLALARHFRFRLGIIPAYWVNDAASHVKLSGYIQVLWETVKVRWWLITGVYTRSRQS